MLTSPTANVSTGQIWRARERSYKEEVRYVRVVDFEHWPDGRIRRVVTERVKEDGSLHFRDGRLQRSSYSLFTGTAKGYGYDLFKETTNGEAS